MAILISWENRQWILLWMHQEYVQLSKMLCSIPPPGNTAVNIYYDLKCTSPQGGPLSRYCQQIHAYKVKWRSEPHLPIQLFTYLTLFFLHDGLLENTLSQQINKKQEVNNIYLILITHNSQNLVEKDKK